MLNDDDTQPPVLPSQPPPSPRRGIGCFLKGCLTTIVIVMLLGVGLGAFGWFFFQSGQAYITEEQIATRVATPTDEQLQALLARLQPFGQAMDEGRAATAELTADDLNALIARLPQFAPLRGQVFLESIDRQLVADLSFPATAAGSPGARFISAHAWLDASYASGKFTFALRRLVPLKGEAKEGLLPSMLRNPTVLQTYSDMMNREFNDFTNDQSHQDPVVADILAKLRTAVIQDDHIVLTSVARPDPSAVATPVDND